MTSFIKVPFASSGDKAAVPDTDAGGGVNMTQGYGQAYSLDPATDPSAKRIERDKMNWLFNRITQAINEIQSDGVAPFITSADNGGSAFSYGKGALVSLGGVVYQSLVASNTSTPPGANWSALPEKMQPLDATLTALAGLVGEANKLPYFNGSDTAALTDLTSVGRNIIGKTDIAAVLTYLGLSDAFLIKDKYLSASLNLNTLGGDGKYGIYAQPVTNNASLSKNYPTQEAGSLLVTPAANNGMQIYTTLSGNVWSRTSLDNTNTQWSSWVRPGFKTLDKNIDLNYLGGVDKYGFYGQSVSNDATPENNYPVKEAGTLLVSPAAYNGLQVYITLSGLIWSRHSLDSTNTNWSQWVRQALKSELDDGLALKFDSSSLSTTGKALVAKSTVADMRTYLQLFSAAQRDVGTGANQIPDMNAFSGSIVSKGYQKFPGGLIIQWGINNASVGGTSGNGEDVSYAIPFPNGCLSLTATFDNGGPVIPAAAASLVDNVYFKLRCSEASGSYIFRWIALGF
ncbi:pyocin knob domain-containing protein [Citrobacter freundii]|uniref:Putative tail fiber protein gp53-like C-terminal domain-containing protein n=1 Tax=uncultured Citrobacter sp. TaxID=200446 RepID=A0A212I988_9ENTR|nr:pyocin knob domain-containing protein [Citrobacter freundii]MDU1172778.1 pyocin knob domain-containing protein [Citrobacter freundii]MDU1221557.1 pyocin knob domain-containing protein [Citrobacter freundii]SBV63357.1 hypothetical protein KL86CIT2_30023 [uncultured Citrobacter sp.]SBV68257.1 hypothetical protein KM92CIT3_80794 [uncultured Citrobacter sp.]